MLENCTNGSPGGEAWFVAFPDQSTSLTVGADISHQATSVIHHSSGRPWIIGSWAESQVAAIRRENAHIAVIGNAAGARNIVERYIDGVTRIEDVTPLARELRGSFFILAKIGDRCRIQGPVSGVKRVFHSANRSGYSVVGSRSDLVAACLPTGRELDYTWLCARLVYPPSPRSLRSGSPWRDVEAVPTETYAALTDSGKVTTHRWWHPPSPEMTVAEAAEPLGEALRSAVAARTDVAGQNLSADLSGGLDSTPLCLLAYQLRSRPLLITQAGDDRANDDARFASLAAASMPGCKHLVQQPHELPLPFSDALTASAGLDEPDSGFRNRSRTAAIGRQLRSFGSTIHIGGAGGDEVLQPPPTYLHGLIRRTPRRGYRYVQAFRARRPACGRGDMLHFLMNQSSYTEWQQQQIADLTSPMPRHLLGSWGTPFRLPPWLTNDAVEIVRDSLTNSQNDEPFDTERGQHDAAESIINAGRVTRMTGQTLAQEFLSSEFPFLDDHVVNIALSVRPEEKADPWTFKPLIRAAMEREVPSEVLSRSTKADVSSEVYDGMRKSREDLLKICTESHLAEAGLLDIDSLVDTLEAPPNPNHHPTMLNETLATEAWLRANA